MWLSETWSIIRWVQQSLWNQRKSQSPSAPRKTKQNKQSTEEKLAKINLYAGCSHASFKLSFLAVLEEIISFCSMFIFFFMTSFLYSHMDGNEIDQL